jgi:hypothetical protein
MVYRVILIGNGEYKKTLHKCKSRDTSFLNYNLLIEENKSVKFPKKYINTNKIKPIKYKICVVKPTESTDTFRILRNDFGKTYKEKPIGDWTIIASNDYNIEESFWIYGYEAKNDRVTIEVIVKKLFSGAYKKNMVKQIIVVHNKLIIYNENQFDMVICKCKEDAQRLHHTLANICKKQKIKNFLFMGTASKATISLMYEIIKKNTGWSIEKIRRTSTRP